VTICVRTRDESWVCAICHESIRLAETAQIKKGCEHAYWWRAEARVLYCTCIRFLIAGCRFCSWGIQVPELDSISCCCVILPRPLVYEASS